MRYLAIALLGLAGCAHSPPAGESVWDDKAAAEATHVMHELHQAWNTMDIVTVEKYVAEDGFLTIFEIGDNESPVQLKSRAELLAFLKRGFNDFKSAGASTVATPVVDMTCRATSNMAVCTEECDIMVTLADGKREVTPHRGTSVLRKGSDGWKFTHWHVSEKGPKYFVDAKGNRLSLSGGNH